MSQAGAEHKLYDPAFIRSLRPFDQKVEGLVTKPEQYYRAALALDPADVPDPICSHCQQCAEKYLKALIVDRGGTYPKVHGLERLARLAASAELEVEPLFEHLQPLKSNMNFRYPGWNASAEDAEAATKATSYLRSQLRGLLGLNEPT